MRRVASALSPLIAVDRRAAKPLHKQLYDAFREGILERRLRPGQQVPSTRALAAELGLSRIPILSAYSQLLAEGYFDSRSGAGTFVSSSLPEQLTSCVYDGNGAAGKTRSGPRLISSRSRELPRFNPAPWLFGWGAFSVGQLALDYFPFRIWSSLVTRYCRKVRVSALHFSSPRGSEEFRRTIANYLRTARAVNCEPEQILVVNGSQQALEISARVLLDPGNRVWVEEPGYRLAWHVLRMTGCQLVPVPVDQDGLDVSAGCKRYRRARAAYVTPSHQFPLGVTMSASRRLQLLDWAQSTGSWIIEDDYDSEYRYESMPIASLQGIDRNSRVIYIGTFSKTLFPSLRLGYMVVPPDLVDRFVAVRHAMDVYPPHLYQAVLTDFIGEGHFARHIRRTRMLYQERRNALVGALEAEFSDRMEIVGGEAGLHLVVKLPKGVRDRELSERAAKQKLWLWPLSPCYLEKNPQQGLILGFGSTAAREIPRAVRRLRLLLPAG
jgi:GntR family transcriptional regulator / MocR family aminotransferase